MTEGEPQGARRNTGKEHRETLDAKCGIGPHVKMPGILSNLGHLKFSLSLRAYPRQQ